MTEQRLATFLDNPAFVDAVLRGVPSTTLRDYFAPDLKPRRMQEVAAVVRAVQRTHPSCADSAEALDPPAPSPVGPPPPDRGGLITEETHDHQGNAWVVTLKPTTIHTLEQLLAYCDVDTAVWEVERFVVNKWDMGGRNETGELVSKPLYQVKAWLKRRIQVVRDRAALSDLLEDLKALPPLGIARAPQKPGRFPVMAEACLFDHHFGKLAWGEETGASYDLKIAQDLWWDAVQCFLGHLEDSPDAVEEILFPLGHDLLHCDSSANTTTKGTPQDSDTRYRKVYREVRQLLCETITRLAQVAPVTVKIVPGNHDQNSMFTIGDALQCWFKDCPDVSIDNRAALRKYHRYGQNLFCLTHGSEEKVADLPLIMAREAAADWGQTTYQEVQIGHLHHTRQLDQKGVLIRTLPSLCATDSYHASKGYIGSQRRAELLLFDKDGGPRQQITYLPREPRPYETPPDQPPRQPEHDQHPGCRRSSHLSQ